MKTILVVLVVTLGGFLAAATPANAALVSGCHEPSGSATVLSPPGGQVVGWAPACIVVKSGETLQWVIADTIAHGVLAHGCFDSGLLVPGKGTSARFTFDAATGRVLAQSGTGPARACDLLDHNGEPAVQPIEGGAELRYICDVHQLTMVGRIRVVG